MKVEDVDCTWRENDPDACPFCAGEKCNKCGAGCWSNVDNCEHDSMERHEAPDDEPENPGIQPADGTWYWVEYAGLGRTYNAPAMYKADADCFYSYEFSGIPRRQLTVLRAA
jgi:hypothetical protein